MQQQKQEKFFVPHQSDEQGNFQRQTSNFRNSIGQESFPADAKRYHLYLGYTCPWAMGVFAAYNLFELNKQMTYSIVSPVMSDAGWQFDQSHDEQCSTDPHFNAQYLHQIYSACDKQYSGRATIPILYDKYSKQIVNNESIEIIKMFNQHLKTDQHPDLYPKALQKQIDSAYAVIYPNINNGVYRVGFATSQNAYELAIKELFACIDEIEHTLADGRKYIIDDVLSLIDIRLFMTLIRFDTAYYGLFKTNLSRVSDYSHLSRYMRGLYDLPWLRATVNFNHIKTGYYTLKSLNPHMIVPTGPKEIFGGIIAN